MNKYAIVEKLGALFKFDSKHNSEMIVLNYDDALKYTNTLKEKYKNAKMQSM